MGMIQRLIALSNTTRQSIFSSPTLTTKTLLNPLHHHSLFPLQTPLTTTKTTYSTNSSKRVIRSVLPSPLTWTHRMKLRFLFPNNDFREFVAKEDPTAEVETPFTVLSEPRGSYRPMIGDGEDGGGIAFYNSPWVHRALFHANEVLSQFGNDFKLYGFVTSPNGIVMVRIESFSNEYGCPSLEMLYSYVHEYRKRLVEDSVIPDDLEIAVGCPGLGRLVKVPDDLSRFKDVPLRVSYVESDGKEQEWVFFLCSVEKEQGYCLWNLSDYDPVNKDKPVSRARWTLKLQFEAHKRVTFFIQP